MAGSFQNDFLQKQLQCPVCYENLKPPVKQCTNGHIICSSCVTRLTRCPLCNQALLENNPTFVNNLLAALPQLCKNSSQGCKKICEDGDDHEVYCGFRSVYCMDCKQIVQVNKFLNHYKTSHKNRHCLGPKGELSYRPFSPDENYYWWSPVILGGTVFYIFLYKKEEGWNLCLIANFVMKPLKEQFVTLEIENGKFFAASTLTPVKDIDVSDIGNDFYSIAGKVVEKNEHLCMRVSQKLMHRLVDNIDKKLVVSYTFFQQ